MHGVNSVKLEINYYYYNQILFGICFAASS
jgi:hypothetical protein